VSNRGYHLGVANGGSGTTVASQTAATTPAKPARIPGTRSFLNPKSGVYRSASAHTRILAAVRRIPRGRVATYGQVAQVAGVAGQPRLVGYALRHAEDTVPWHRVVNAEGAISPRAAADSVPRQRALLEAEGVRFSPTGRIDLERFRWRPRVRHRASPTSSGRT
jgi:methylated-DNA-protein-cysteine methyltransferase-like protein